MKCTLRIRWCKSVFFYVYTRPLLLYGHGSAPCSAATALLLCGARSCCTAVQHCASGHSQLRSRVLCRARHVPLGLSFDADVSDQCAGQLRSVLHRHNGLPLGRRGCIELLRQQPQWRMRNQRKCTHIHALYCSSSSSLLQRAGTSSSSAPDSDPLLAGFILRSRPSWRR